jgi:phosphoglycerate kinase
MGDTAREILAKAAGETGCEIVLPTDVVVATEFAANAREQHVAATPCPPGTDDPRRRAESVARVARPSTGRRR